MGPVVLPMDDAAGVFVNKFAFGIAAANRLSAPPR
jgi:hypothetical protein